MGKRLRGRAKVKISTDQKQHKGFYTKAKKLRLKIKIVSVTNIQKIRNQEGGNTSSQHCKLHLSGNPTVYHKRLIILGIHYLHDNMHDCTVYLYDHSQVCDDR